MVSFLGFGLAFWLLAIVAVTINGISKSGFAGGIGVVSVPLMALVIDPAQAAAILLPLLIVMDYLSIKAWWGKQKNDLLKLLVPAAIAGIGAGYLLYDVLNAHLLKTMLGVVSLFFAGWGLFKGANISSHAPSWVGRICGMIAGFTSFIAHAGGPPVNFYLIPKRLPREQFLATAVVFFTIINLVKLIPYAVLGQINVENLSVAAVLAPFAWLGVKLGLLIQNKLNDELFYRLILCMLLLIGTKLIWDGMA